jgi:hypothetical protein
LVCQPVPYGQTDDNDFPVDYSTLIQRTPQIQAHQVPLIPTPVQPIKHLPTPPRHTQPESVQTTPYNPPQTIATLSAHLDRDSKGHEHLHATLKDHTGVKKVDEAVPVHETTGLGLTKEAEGGELEIVVREKTKKESKDEKKRRKEEEKERRKEPVYRSLGGVGLPPPKSESKSSIYLLRM